MELSQAILSQLNDKPGQTSAEMAKKLAVDKKSINTTLYRYLHDQCYQDKQYRWFLKKQTPTLIETSSEQFADTPLSRLCRYYLACLGHDDEGGVSVFATNKFGDLDYAELESLPLDGGNAIFRSESAQRLLGKLKKDSRLTMYLGYPTALKKVKSKRTNWEGYFVEPILLFPIELDEGNSGSPKLSHDFPIINLSVLKRFANAEREAVMNELVQLEEELGLSDEKQPEMDDLVQRLAAIRPGWPWLEPVNPNNVKNTSSLAEIGQEGILNRAVLVVGERSPYTQGLETELKALARLTTDQYAGTALGKWVAGQIAERKEGNISSLIEVLPLNSEQRQAIQQTLTNSLTIITGPPGTGKSQVVSNLLINAAWQNKRILFASKNNKAVDVVETRINNLGPRPILLRVGAKKYQTRLADYLINLLSATATQDDEATFNEAKKWQDQLESRFIEIKQQEAALIALRNRVDSLEQAVEHARTVIESTILCELRIRVNSAAPYLPDSFSSSIPSSTI